MNVTFEQREAVIRQALQSAPPACEPPPDVLPPHSWRQSVRRILDQTCERHGIPLEELLSHRRVKYLEQARHEAMYRCVAETFVSYAELGGFLRRDHSTLIHAVAVHAARTGLPRPRYSRPKRVGAKPS